MNVRLSVRGVLLLDAAALAAAAGAATLGLGLPLAARHALGPPALAAVAAAVGLCVLAIAAALLLRGVGRPIDRLLGAAAGLDPGAAATGEGGLPLLGDGPEGGRGVLALGRAAVAFERLALALREDRAALAAKVRELTAANRALAEAREELVRSEKLATVGRLAAGVAHEVGNPLGAIAGYAALARARLPREADPELADALERIDAAARRIDGIVRDLLDFARPSPPALAPIELAPAVDATLRLARAGGRLREVEVETDLSPALPRVAADERQLSQVLLNLLLNADHAMGGRGRVRITGAVQEGGARVALRVEDTGHGIAPADLPRIFDPFFTTKEPGEGTGLGLAISHRILESFGGEIRAGNGPGGGAVFELRLRAAGERVPAGGGGGSIPP